MSRDTITSNNKRWFKNAEQTADELGWQMTAVVDLDSTLVIHQVVGNEYRQSGFVKFRALSEVHAATGIEFVDQAAFVELSQFQRRGHRVKVVTAGAYLHSGIKEIFERHGIMLAEHDYHNRVNIAGKNFRMDQKAQYIDSIPEFDENHMLFDDYEENRPENRCCFYHVTLAKKFPSLDLAGYHLNELLIEMSSITSIPTANDWNHLGSAYFNAKNGKTRDDEKAKLCCEEALKLDPNYAYANYNLGLYFQYGRGGTQNLSKAKAFYTTAKENGNVHAPLRLLEIEMQEERQRMQEERQRWLEQSEDYERQIVAAEERAVLCDIRFFLPRQTQALNAAAVSQRMTSSNVVNPIILEQTGDQDDSKYITMCAIQ